MSTPTTYVVLDNNGLVLSVIEANTPQSEDCVECVGFVLPSDRPSPFHRYHFHDRMWVDIRPIEWVWGDVRKERDRRLSATDWTQLPDVPLATKEVWATYRQALRDITQVVDPFNVVWPAPPIT